MTAVQACTALHARPSHWSPVSVHGPIACKLRLSSRPDRSAAACAGTWCLHWWVVPRLSAVHCTARCRVTYAEICRRLNMAEVGFCPDVCHTCTTPSDTKQQQMRMGCHNLSWMPFIALCTVSMQCLLRPPCLVCCAESLLASCWLCRLRSFFYIHILLWRPRFAYNVRLTALPVFRAQRRYEWHSFALTLYGISGHWL
jgi:hypothetical protein